MDLESTLSKFNFLKSKGVLGNFNLIRSFSFTDEPKFFQYVCSNSDNEEGGASCDTNGEFAKVKALGEYVERFCLDNPQEEKLVKGKYLSGMYTDPRKFVNFRNEDIGGRKEEYLNKILETEFLWVNSIDFEGKETMVPAQLVYINYPFNEPILRPRISTGAAAHENRQKAIISGILENIERDSYMLTFYTKRRVPKISLSGELKELEEYFRRYKLELNIFETTTDLGIPSFMCATIDRTEIGPAVSIGLSAGLNPTKAIRHALLEAQQIRQWIRYKYVNENSPKINYSEDINETHHRGYYWYPKKRIENLDFLLGNNEKKAMEDIITPKSKDLKEVIKTLKIQGIETFIVDINRDAIRKCGFEVIKVLQPQLHPMFLEQNLPTLDSKRMKKYANGNELNNIPHPFI